MVCHLWLYGSLLLLIYINDLFKASLNLTYAMFVHDTSLLLSEKYFGTLFQLMNTELEKAIVWFKANKLPLNISKTK